MGEQQHYATFRYDIPDNSLSPDERALFAPPAAKKVVKERLELLNFWTSPEVVKGADGLDVQGFTYVEHQSALESADRWLTGTDIEEVYIRECEDLICKVTGAKRAVANNVFFRRQTKNPLADPTFVALRGSDLDKAVAQLPRHANYGRPPLSMPFEFILTVL